MIVLAASAFTSVKNCLSVTLVVDVDGFTCIVLVNPREKRLVAGVVDEAAEHPVDVNVEDATS